MISALWRSADSSGLAIQSDWTNMPIGPRSITHVLGDGSLNAVSTSVLTDVLREVARVLKPEGSLIARVFCRPASAESAGDIKRDVQLGRAGSFHALKWRVAMAALRDPASSDIAVGAIRDAVVAQYPDRDALCRATGWSRAEVDTLDVYDGSSVVYNFPTEAAIFALLQRWFATVEIIRCGSYPLAERCPILVARRPILIDVKRSVAANSRGDARSDQCRVTLDLSAFDAFISDATSPATSMKCASSFMRRVRAILLSRTSSLRM